MLKLLIDSLAKEFYQQHAGFFLVGIYISFGVVEPSQLIGYQKALLLAGISSPIGMVIVFVSWFLYATKVHFFIKQKLALAKYNFIKETAALEKRMQLKLWLRLYFTILLPVIIYVFLLISLSINYNLFISAICILILFYCHVSILAHYYLLFSLALLACCILYYLLMFNKIDLKGIEE